MGLRKFKEFFFSWWDCFFLEKKNKENIFRKESWSLHQMNDSYLSSNMTRREFCVWLIILFIKSDNFIDHVNIPLELHIILIMIRKYLFILRSF